MLSENNRFTGIAFSRNENLPNSFENNTEKGSGQETFNTGWGEGGIAGNPWMGIRC